MLGNLKKFVVGLSKKNFAVALFVLLNSCLLSYFLFIMCLDHLFAPSRVLHKLRTCRSREVVTVTPVAVVVTGESDLSALPGSRKNSVKRDRRPEVRVSRPDTTVSHQVAEYESRAKKESRPTGNDFLIAGQHMQREKSPLRKSYSLHDAPEDGKDKVETVEKEKDLNTKVTEIFSEEVLSALPNDQKSRSHSLDGRQAAAAVETVRQQEEGRRDSEGVGRLTKNGIPVRLL